MCRHPGFWKQDDVNVNDIYENNTDKHVHALQDRVPDDVYYNAKNTDMHGHTLQDRASDDMYDKDTDELRELALALSVELENNTE